ncbi:MAG: RND family transporter [Alphaproteobacteria bacterium]
MGSIGFGLERIGLFAVAKPRVMLSVIALVLAFAVFGATKTRFADNLTSIFQSPSSTAYQTYDQFRGQFVDGSDAAILVLDGDFKRQDHWLALQGLIHAVEALPSVGDVVSIVSLDRLETSAGDPEPEDFEDDIFDNAEFEAAALEQALSHTEGEPATAEPNKPDMALSAEALSLHPLNEGGRLLSPDFETATLVLALPEKGERLEEARAIEQDLAPLIASLPDGMTAMLSGLPIVRAEIVRHLIEEHPLLLGGGLSIGFLLGVALLGVLVDAVIVAVMPMLSIVMVYGAFGWLDIPMTVLLNDLPLLVLALAFAANMHLVYAARRDLFAANYDFKAIAKTIGFIGPACSLASMTTVVAFLSLVFSGSRAVVEFGLIGAASVAGVFISAMVFFPASVWVALHLGWRPRPTFRGTGWIAKGIEAAAVALTRTLYGYRLVITVVIVAFTVAAGLAYSQVSPSYTYLEEVPDDSETFALMQRLEEELGGAHTLHMPLPIPVNAENFDLAPLLKLRSVHKAVEADLGRPVYSAWTIVSWLSDTGRTVSAPRLETVFNHAPQGLKGLLLSRDGSTLALVVRVAETDKTNLADVAARIEAIAGEELEADLTGQATGIVVLASRVSEEIIRRLGISLVIAALGTSLLVGLGFRSFEVSLLTIVPNILPVLAVGGLLYVFDWPLQLASALAMTIALGIAVDDTVHMMNGFWAQRCAGRAPRTCLAKTMRDVGPVLVLTSLVLMLGLAPALLSWSPGIATFALFAIATIGIALVTCLVALPAILALRFHKGAPGRLP